MKTKKLFWLMAIFAMLTVAPSCDKDDDNSNNNGEDPTEDPIDESLPLSLQGTNYYVIQLDETSFSSLGKRVANDLRPNGTTRFLDVWAQGETYSAGTCQGPNAYGEITEWVSLVVVAPDSWSGAGWRITDGVDMTGIDDTYNFHIAIKSPSNQPTAGHTFIFNSDGNEIKLFFGPESEAGSDLWYANYTHDGEWNHFDIPVSTLMEKGYMWENGLNGNVLGVLSGSVAGRELNIDAMFFYKPKK